MPAAARGDRSCKAARVTDDQRAQLARYIDHTILKPEATAAQVATVCREAAEAGVAAVCISPSFLPLDQDVYAQLVDGDVSVCTVIAFPSGAVRSEVKAQEAAFAVAAGADEVDMVVNLGLVKAAEWDLVEADIAAVRLATPMSLLKVILETGALTEGEIVHLCEVCVNAGADFVKTSTGFHPSGGATESAVRLMRETVGEEIGVKASGGIRDLAGMQTLISAGANRIGTSATLAILGAR